MQYGCCTFTTQRKNKSKKIARVELSLAQRNRWDDDWLQYWFYIKIDMSNASSIGRAFYSFYNSLGPMDITTAPLFFKSGAVKDCENAYVLASSSITGQDLVEEFLVANIWPLSDGWGQRRFYGKPLHGILVHSPTLYLV